MRSLRSSAAALAAKTALEKIGAADEAAAEMRNAPEPRQAEDSLLLSTLLHDLRTPLNGVQTWAHVLEQRLPAGDATALRALSGIRRGIDDQVRLIDDAQILAQAVGGKLELHAKTFDLAAMLGAAIDAVRSEAPQKSARIEADFPSEEVNLVGDPDLVRRICLHVLQHAMKFTPPDEIVKVRLTVSDEAGGRTAHLRVRDAGPPVSKRLLPQLFDAFAFPGDERPRGGPGFGLTLVRYLVELHGGGVGAQSVCGGSGVEVTVDLPLAHVDC